MIRHSPPKSSIIVDNSIALSFLEKGQRGVAQSPRHRVPTPWRALAPFPVSDLFSAYQRSFSSRPQSGSWRRVPPNFTKMRPDVLGMSACRNAGPGYLSII
jgi:hypothetical protein